MWSASFTYQRGWFMAKARAARGQLSHEILRYWRARADIDLRQLLDVSTLSIPVSKLRSFGINLPKKYINPIIVNAIELLKTHVRSIYGSPIAKRLCTTCATEPTGKTLRNE